MPLFQVRDGLGDVAQGIGPVDDRRELAGFDEFRQGLEVLGGLLREERAEPLAHER